jgi:oligopeptide/dipeptide ABC transporter ATP-binding protein
VPEIDIAARSARLVLPGEPPDATSPPSGCVFHPRCPLAVDRCAAEVPQLRTVRPARLVACHRAEEVLAGAMMRAGQPLSRSRRGGEGGNTAKSAPPAWRAPAGSGDGPSAG